MNFIPSPIKRNESKSACSACKKRCCDNMPGIVFPEQLKEITVKSVAKMLRNGYCLDWWEGDPRAKSFFDTPFAGQLSISLFIRPQIASKESKVFHGAWGGKCSFLTPTGCKLTFKNRPLECQALVPNEKSPGDCKPKKNYSYSKDKAAFAWIPYQDILQQAGDLVQSE